MARFEQGKLVAVAYRIGRAVAVSALTKGIATVLVLGVLTTAPSSHAAASQKPTAPLQACVLPESWHHLCTPPITKAAWQQKYHCTFCAVTMNDLKSALPNATSQMLSAIFNDLNGHMVEYGLDSPARLMNFFAQVEAETSYGSPRYIVESDNYSVDGLKVVNYFKSYPTARCEYGRLDASDHVAIAECKALDPKGLHKEWWTPHAANPQVIANRMYDGSGGNGKFPSNDGWTYRGRGLLQVTRKDNYAMQSMWYNEMYHPTVPVDFVKAPDLLAQPDYAFKVSVEYWLGNAIEKDADKTDFANPCAASDLVTVAVNGGGASKKTKRDRCQLLKNLQQGGVFGEIDCHLPGEIGPGRPPNIPLPPSPPMPPLPPETPPSSSPPVGIAAHGARPAPPSSGRH